MNFAATFARYSSPSSPAAQALSQRATALGFAALVTLSMLGGVDALATAPAHDMPTMAQQADQASRG